jgi:hypothetical protein
MLLGMESARDFAKSFKGFMDQMAASAPNEEPELLRRFREHLGLNPSSLAIVSHAFAASDHANVQLALDAWAAEPTHVAESLGVVSDAFAYMGISLAAITSSGGSRHGPRATIGPVQYVNVDLGDDRVLACMQSGILLLSRAVSDGEDRQSLIVLVQGPSDRAMRESVTLEVLAPRREDAQAFIDGLRATIRRRSVYRGRVISLGATRRGSLEVNFHRLPPVVRENIILPTGTLERIERHTVGFAAKQELLRAAGRHLKRGLLLYGPPGTGKTFTATYLSSQMPGRTVLLVTGRAQGLIEQTCEMARALAPATVILEDVDLIGTARDQDAGVCARPLLFELLNQMDGLGEDCDVLFILTTNRPEILEPALAARPGRVDQAIEFPLPDEPARRRLLQLYSRGLNLGTIDWNNVVRRTRGASAAFIKEMMRRAALFAADKGPRMLVTDHELDEALHELTIRGGGLTRSLLGFNSGESSVDAHG